MTDEPKSMSRVLEETRKAAEEARREATDLDRVQDDLRRFCDAKSTADELDHKIAFTDALIDPIVYRLYGLTDEEIEIVEAEVGQ